MRCGAIRARLVAYQDNELSPGEFHFVEEHLRSCAACRADEQALARATPWGGLAVPDTVQRRLEARLDPDAIRAVAARRPEPAPSALSHVRAWMRREVWVSRGSVLALAAAFSLTAMWALHSWWAVAELEATLARHEAQASPAGGEIQPGQYAPASYTPPSTDAPPSAR